MVVRRGSTEDVPLEQRPEQDEEVSHKTLWRGECQESEQQMQSF